MNEIEIIRAINKASQEHYDTENNKHEHLPYLADCNKSLTEFLKAYQNRKNRKIFLFSALTYKNEFNVSEPFGVVPGSDKCTQYNFADDACPTKKDAVKDLLADAKNQTAINLTTALLLKKLGQDFFFFSGKSYCADIVTRQSIKAYDLGKLKFTTTEEFEKANAQEIKNFISTLSLNGDYTNSQYGKYLWHYKNIEQKYNENKRVGNFYVHLIRPSIIEFDYNLLLSLATNEQLEPNQLAFIDLLIYRIVSQTAIEKIKQHEEIERLRNVSASTHVIKTTVNGLFGPPLNSLLLKYKCDSRIKELQEAKEKILKYAEMVNLITKLSSNKDTDAIRESLVGSSLFTTNSEEQGQIKSVLNEIIKLRKLDPSLTKLTLKLNESKTLSGDAFVYENDYYPTKSFYELLLLTIIENVIKYGAADDGELTVSMELSEMEITFVNKPKPNSKTTINVENMTGNFRVFHTILTKLDLGNFSVSNNCMEFKVTLKAKENE